MADDFGLTALPVTGFSEEAVRSGTRPRVDPDSLYMSISRDLGQLLSRVTLTDEENERKTSVAFWRLHMLGNDTAKGETKAVLDQIEANNLSSLFLCVKRLVLIATNSIAFPLDSATHVSTEYQDQAIELLEGDYPDATLAIRVLNALKSSDFSQMDEDVDEARDQLLTTGSMPATVTDRGVQSTARGSAEILTKRLNSLPDPESKEERTNRIIASRLVDMELRLTTTQTSLAEARDDIKTLKRTIESMSRTRTIIESRSAALRTMTPRTTASTALGVVQGRQGEHDLSRRLREDGPTNDVKREIRQALNRAIADHLFNTTFGRKNLMRQLNGL